MISSERVWIKDKKLAESFIENWLRIKREVREQGVGKAYKIEKIKRILTEDEAKRIRRFYEEKGIKDVIDLVEWMRH